MRPATRADLEPLTDLVARANTTYRTWAGAGWRAPDLDSELEGWKERLGDASVWTAVIEVAGELVGCASFEPAAERKITETTAGRQAYLSRLFIDPIFWRRGLATTLLDAAVEESRSRGFRELGLVVPEANVGARGFYEARGWQHRGRARSRRNLQMVRYSFDLRVGSPR
jgi:ribosomal protein S18 acetylase RimI-like enzyme